MIELSALHSVAMHDAEKKTKKEPKSNAKMLKRHLSRESVEDGQVLLRIGTNCQTGECNLSHTLMPMPSVTTLQLLSDAIHNAAMHTVAFAMTCLAQCRHTERCHAQC